MQWKYSKLETDRLSYRQACRNANILINASRNKDHFRKIEDCTLDTKMKWRAIKDLLHPATCQTISTPDEDKSRATRCATFFRDKFITIKAAISLKLYGVTPDPLRDDKSFREHALLNLLPVTDEEVLKLL